MARRGVSGGTFGGVGGRRATMNDILGSKGAIPTEEAAAAREVTGLVNDLRGEFRLRNQLYDYIDDILFRQIAVNIPDAYRKTSLEIHNPLAQHIVNTVTAALSVNPPTCQFTPVGIGPSFQENATEREHFFDASWRRQEEDGKRRLFRIFMYSLVAKGEAVLKTVERQKTAWADYTKFAKELKATLDDPEGPYQAISGNQDAKDQTFNAKTEEFKRGASYPIRTTFVDPRTFSYIKGEDGFTLCAEVKDVSYIEGLERFGYSLDKSGAIVPQGLGLPRTSWNQAMGNAKSLKLIEVWTWDTVYYLLLNAAQSQGQGMGAAGALGVGTLVKKLKHGYGNPLTKTLRGPYFQALGTTTDSTQPERAGLSILYGYLDLFPMLDSLLTIQTNAAYFTGFPAYKRVRAPGSTLPPINQAARDGSEVDGATTQIVPGSIYPDDIEPIQHPASGPAFLQMIQELRTMMETALPKAAQGTAGSDQSGYAENQQAYMASLNWDPFIDNAETTLAERMSFESWLIENRIKERVYVWGTVPPDLQKQGTKDGWLGMGPAELKGSHNYRVSLHPVTPSNRIIEIRTHQELLQLRLETREDAITDLGGNPDEVERSWLLYDLKQDPAIKDALRKRFFTELATIDQKALGGATALAPPQLGPGGDVGLGGSMANQGQIFQPGQNGQPLTPSPAGSVAGAPGGVAQPPQNAQPLPGQG